MNEPAIKVGDRVSVRRVSVRGSGVTCGDVAALLGAYAWVDREDGAGPITLRADMLTVIPPAPVACLWRNVFPWRLSTHYYSRATADACASSDRLGVVVGYSDGTYNLEVIDQ